jgi:hypothetical protein
MSHSPALNGEAPSSEACAAELADNRKLSHAEACKATNMAPLAARVFRIIKKTIDGVTMSLTSANDLKPPPALLRVFGIEGPRCLGRRLHGGFYLLKGAQLYLANAFPRYPILGRKHFKPRGILC